MKKIIALFLFISSVSVHAQTSGSIDTSFNIGTGFNDVVYGSMVIQMDGKIIIGGVFTMYNGTPRNRITRVNTNGSLDNSFNPGTGFNEWVSDIALQLDGKIIVTGDFTSFNGSPMNRIVRLNPDGSLDNTFIVGTGFDDTPLTAELQQDGKIVIGGWFTSYNGSPVNYFIRLNPNGSIDNSFYSGSGFDGNIETIAQQPDGKWIVSGYFDFFNSTPCPRIARLNINGTVDTSFNPGTGPGAAGSILSIKLQPDGKIMLAGSFSNFNGVPDTSIVRINSDGSVDTSFYPGTGFGDFPFEVWTLVLQSDGKIIAGGQFNNYNNTSCNGIVRLNSDGSIDTSFNFGTGFNYHMVFSSALQTDGKLIAGGSFNSYDGAPSNNIIRLNAFIITGQKEIHSDKHSFNLFPNPATSELRIENAELRIKEVEIYNTLGEKVYFQQETSNRQPVTVDVSQFLPGVYFVAVTDDKGNKITRRFIKL